MGPETVQEQPLPRHLAPGPLMQFDRAEFQTAAPRFPAGEPLETARAAFQWTRNHMKPGPYVRNDLGASHALHTGSGDCTEHMALFAALCRMHGIPARGLGGYICPRNGLLRPADFHNWAEFYADGKWRLVDTQKGRFDQGGTDYVATRIYGDDNSVMQGFPRFRYEGDGLKVRMN